MTTTTRELAYFQAINEAIQQEMERDSTIIVMGEDVAGAAGRAHLGFIDAWGGPWRTTKGLIQRFGPQRVLDTPISEAGFVGTAVGAAMTGLRPIVEVMYSDFFGVCMDQVINQAAKMLYMTGGQIPMPMVIRTAIGTRADPKQLNGGGAAAQHSQVLYSHLVHMPGLKCVAPSNAYNAKGLMISAIRDDDPVVIFDHKFFLSDRRPVPEEPYTIPIGVAEVARPGRDVTLVGISRMTQMCLQAAQELEAYGVDAEVVDLLSLSPLDEATILASLRKTHRLVVVDEDSPRCSVARDVAAIAADKAFDYLDAPIKTVTPPHTPVPFSAVLEGAYVPDAKKVVATVADMLGLALERQESRG